MKLEKVLKNARNALIGVGLSGAVLLGATGCGTFLYSTVQGAGEETGRQIAQGVVKEREEKKQEQVQEGLRTHIFACNYFKDFNNNSASDYPNEFVGIKNKFRADEKIVLVSYNEKSKKGQLEKWEIYNPFGELIDTGQAISEYNRNVNIFGENFDMTGWLIQRGGYGNYKFVYYLDGKYVDSTEFEIAKW